MRQILIVGAGASGMTAAIHAARAGAEVILLEQKDRPGKKILSTGNGRCNLTNLDQREEYYRCSCPSFPSKALEQFSVEDTLEFFGRLGILPKSRNGYIYPNSDQAASVLEALLQELKALGVRVICNTPVTGAVKKGEAFFVYSGDRKFRGDALILAAGSKAAPATGSDGSGYELASGFGHRLITPLPALVQLRCGEKHYKRLAGVRTEARVSLYASGTFLASDQGELQLTDYGISGIPTFQVSRYASVALHRKQEVVAKIHFLPQMDQGQARDLLSRRREDMRGRTCLQFMNGLLNSKLSAVLLNLAGIREDQPVTSVTEAQWDKLFTWLTNYETKVTAVNSFEHAQVCCGGVDVGQVREDTLESKLVPGLYFCGELLDVDGICGGYNLQWAWSSGATVGRNSAGLAGGAKASRADTRQGDNIKLNKT